MKWNTYFDALCALNYSCTKATRPGTARMDERVRGSRV